MLCEKCKKRTATVFYNENINGKSRSYSLCGECASKLREKGELQDIISRSGSLSAPFFHVSGDLFGGLFGIPMAVSTGSPKKCPACGCTYAEIRHSGKVGCPTCYTAFRQELKGLLSSIHGVTSHTGSIPSKYRVKKEQEQRLASLKLTLEKAIADEDYEKAASLRDEIRKLQADTEKEEA